MLLRHFFNFGWNITTAAAAAGDSKDVRFQLDLIATPAEITLKYSTIQIYTFNFVTIPLNLLFSRWCLRKEMTSHLVNVSRQLAGPKLKLRSEMFESFKNCAANLHQLRPLPTKHPCQLQKSQTPKIQQSLPSLHANTMPWNYFDVGGFHKILQKSIGIVVSEILLSREFHRVS